MADCRVEVVIRAYTGSLEMGFRRMQAHAMFFTFWAWRRHGAGG
jgi:hypothetical protein